nr:MAG TPA: hypothetical protein [Caudoviricetes sp.]
MLSRFRLVGIAVAVKVQLLHRQFSTGFKS